MNTPRRIQLSCKKGWRLPPNTVVVSRPSKWGNPFNFSDVLDHYRGDKRAAAADCVRSFKTWVESQLQNGTGYPLRELRGKNLACWCGIIDKHGNYQLCHADILLALANGMTEDEVRNENLKAYKRRQKQPD